MPNIGNILVGLALIALGLTFFIYGLEMDIFPIGEPVPQAFTKKDSMSWLLTFVFCLGFGSPVAEPSLIAVTKEAASVAASGVIIDETLASSLSYANGLRFIVAFGVGFVIVIIVD